MKLLLVDDHDGVRRALRMMLELNTPFEVIDDVANGLEALECMGEVLPDVVIMDAHMPVMDGVEATREIKQRWPEVCVLAFTSTGEVRRVAPMLDAGARGWVFKGQSHEDLVAHIRTSIRDRGRSRRPVPGKIFLAAPGATSGVGSPFVGGEGHGKGGRSGLRRLLLLPQRSDPNRYGREG